MLRPLTSVFALASLALIAPVASAKLSPNIQAKAALERVLPEIRFNGVAIRDCLDFLRDISGANIHVNWKALEAAGVGQETQINMRLRSVGLGKVMDMLLSESGAQARLTYYLDEGVIEVTTKELSDKIMITKVYNVEDLLVEISDFQNTTDFSLASSTGSSGSGYGTGTGTGYGTGSGTTGRRTSSGTTTGGRGTATTGTGTPGSASTAGKTKADRGNALVQLITETIQPDVWRPTGSAAIKFWQGNLIVTAPRSVHEQIGGAID